MNNLLFTLEDLSLKHRRRSSRSVVEEDEEVLFEETQGCSWCLRKTKHFLVESNFLMRDVYKCGSCQNRTLLCREQCNNFARGLPDWDEEKCALCYGKIYGWEIGKPRPKTEVFDPKKLENVAGWCSHCYQNKPHVIFVNNSMTRNVYECLGCNKHTVACRLCSDGLARSHDTWHEDLCACCAKSITEWGETHEADTYAREALCSLCRRPSRHLLSEYWMWTHVVYTCGSCQEKVVPCQVCSRGMVQYVHDPPEGHIPECYACQNPDLEVNMSTEIKLTPVVVVVKEDAIQPVVEEDREFKSTMFDIKEESKYTQRMRLKAMAARKRLNKDIGVADEKEVTKEDEFRIRFSQMARTVEYRANDTVIEEGVASSRFYLIAKGSVRVEKVIGGELKLLATLSVNETLGDMTFLQGGVATATVKANDGLSMYIVDHTEMDQIEQKDGGAQFCEWFYQFLACKLADRVKISTQTKASDTGFMAAAPPVVEEEEMQSVAKTSDELAKKGVKIAKKFGLENPGPLYQEHKCESQQGNTKRRADLFIFESVICLLSSVFTSETKSMIFFHKIEFVKVGDKADIVLLAEKRFTRLKIKPSSAFQSCLDLIQELIARAAKSPGAGAGSPAKDPGSSSGEVREVVQSSSGSLLEDLLNNANTLTYMPGEIVLREGNADLCLYQVFKGRVRVEKNGKTLAYLNEGQIFGEISFLQQTSASATIVADDDNGKNKKVYISVLDGDSIRQQITTNHVLAGQFYKLLATMLADRLRITSS